MLGAIIGDIVGSRFERENHKSKDFEFFHPSCVLTDDSIMTIAVAEALLRWRRDGADLRSAAVEAMQYWGRGYPRAGYGEAFQAWLRSEDPRPYNSYGNGAAMRVSPCGFAARTAGEARSLAVAVTEVTHNHPESIKAAQAIAEAIFLARTGKRPARIRAHIERLYYPLQFTLDEIRPRYSFDVSCQGSVPQAFEALFEATDFEDAIRNAVSIGGDSDTIAAITGGMAQALFGIPDALRAGALGYMNAHQRSVLQEFERTFA